MGTEALNEHVSRRPKISGGGKGDRRRMIFGPLPVFLSESGRHQLDRWSYTFRDTRVPESHGSPRKFMKTHLSEGHGVKFVMDVGGFMKQSVNKRDPLKGSDGAERAC